MDLDHELNNVAINATKRYTLASAISQEEIRPADHRLCRLRRLFLKSSWSQMQVDMKQLIHVAHVVPCYLPCCTDCVLYII